MNCKQTEALLPLHAGRDLEEKRAALVSEHLQTCAACARVAEEYRESVQLTEQFAPPIFSETVYAGIRQRVLREIETEATAPGRSQTIASVFRPRLTWAIASVLLLVVSIFAIYFIVNRRNVEQQLVEKPPADVQLAGKEGADSERQKSIRVELSPAVKTGGKKQPVAVTQPQRKKSRDSNIVSAKAPEPVLFPPRSGAIVKTLRVELQTKDPKIRIIWFVQPETKPFVQGSKGT